MHTFELKVPPPIVALILGLAMWGLAQVTTEIAASGILSTLAASLIALIGGAFSLLGAIAFRRAKTTVNPLKPESASTLVTSGIYRITRNPMYLGLLLVLLGLTIFLMNPWSIFGPVVFVAYIARFQIKPEERVLLSLFGEQYISYTTRVRRWL